MLKMMLLLVCLSAFASANDYDLLQEMTQYDFGKTIIATLQIELSNGDNGIDNVVSQLKTMQDNAQADIKENDQNIRTRSESCNVRFVELQTVIDSASAKKVDDERALPIKQDEMEIKFQQLQDKVGQDQRNSDRIFALDKSREEERQLYKEKQEESVEFVSGLKKAKGIISQLKSSFLQVTDVQKKLKSHTESLNKSSPYYGLVVMLMESADSESAHKIVQIIDELIESLQHLQQVDRLGDEQKEKLYMVQRARFELENKGLEATIATLQADLEKLKQNLLELNNDIDSKEALIGVKGNELKDWQKTCNDDLKSSQTLRQQKNDELSIISECIEIFTSRFNQGIRSFVQKLEI